MTGFQYRYVGVIGVGDREKKTTEKKRVSFSVSFFLGNRKTDFKKSVFDREKPRKNDRKKRLSVFGSQPCCCGSCRMATSINANWAEQQIVSTPGNAYQVPLCLGSTGWLVVHTDSIHLGFRQLERSEGQVSSPPENRDTRFAKSRSHRRNFRPRQPS